MAPQQRRPQHLARRAALRACERTEGRPLFAGHADLSTYYDVAVVSQLIRELQ